MELVHDLLDKALYDKCHQAMGRVDGIVLELRDGEPPRVACVEVGGTVLARRLHPRLARWAARVRGWWADRGGSRAPRPTRFAPAALTRDGIAWRADDVDGRDTPALAWELWLREHVVARMPGGGK
jgi:hypothetical protein